MTDIRETIIRGPRCVERFVPLERPCCKALREHNVVMAGISDLRGRYVVDRNNYFYHVVLMTLGGAGSLTAAGTTRTLGPGDLLVAPRGTRFHYELAANRWHILWLHLERSDLWRALDHVDVSVHRARLLERLHGAMTALFAEAYDAHPDAPRAARAYAELIALHLRRELEPDLSPADREYRARFEKLWDQVNARPSQRWSVHDLARRFGTSAPHFYRLCREHCALTPKQMVFQLRMRRAEELLRNTTYALKTIAPSAGYDSPYAFSYAFKRHSGVSPQRYRESLARGSKPQA